MKKPTLIITLALALLLGLAGLALAADKEVQVEGLKFFTMIVTAAGFGISAAAIGCAIAQSLAARVALEGTARNPEASGKITVTMLISLALMESLCIYALVVALILLYAYPMAAPLAKFIGVSL